MANGCPLCAALEQHDLLAANDLAAAIHDAFPVSPGHALILSRRHVAGLFDLRPEEMRAIWALLPAVRAVIESGHCPDGYNVGVNVGVAAGQTIAHVHLHVIPRYAGDAGDPRGGVRRVLPARADYWSRGD